MAQLSLPFSLPLALPHSAPADASRGPSPAGPATAAATTTDVAPAAQEGEPGLRVQQRLQQTFDRPVALIWTDNRRTMISVARRPANVEVRLHRMFRQASAEVTEALCRYVNGQRDHRSGARLDAFIAANAQQIRPAVARPRLLVPHGAVHDLAGLFTENNARYFSDAVDARLTWGRASRRGRKRSIRLGTYAQHQQLITIHPVLDQAWVPRFVVGFVLFHEMLHHVVPARERGGRHCFHTAEFRLRERAHPDYLAAAAWERANVERLLRESSRVRRGTR